MVLSAITHWTGRPQAYFSSFSYSSLTASAMAMVFSSTLSRTPLRRPSMVGRMPILGSSPIRRFFFSFMA